MPKLSILLLALGATLVRAAGPEVFEHPGLLHSREDLARMRRAVAEKREPIHGGFEQLRAHPASQPGHAPHAAAEIGRNPPVNHPQFDADASAAYQCALLWSLTGDRALADTARSIVDAWSASLQRVTGADAVLMAGLGPFKLVNAAELLRHTDAGWPAASAARTERMLRAAICPALENFAPYANGNWDTAAIKTLAAIAVFCDDRALFERALRYYVAGAGDGRLTHYILDESGQCQESGRDMGHTQLGLAHLADTCEIAWHQGLDLYGYADNRLLRGFEYTARYNLGGEVPFVETLDRTGKYHHAKISSIGRGNLRPVFEQVYHHYVNRAGLTAPWTRQAAEKLRPEGASRPAGDHPGFGTLLYSREPAAQAERAAAAPRAPAGIVARGSALGVALTWIPARGATHYAVTRVEWPAQTATVVAPAVPTAEFADATTTPGRLYSYRIAAINARGASPAAESGRIAAGLPRWQATDVGAPHSAGETMFDGERFTLEAGGADIGGARDQFHFVHEPLATGRTIVARFLPGVNSQVGTFGVMLRASTAADAAHAALLISADPSPERERPAWSAQLVARRENGGATTSGGRLVLEPPLVEHGRLLRACWLRLERSGRQIVAAISADGTAWEEVGAIDAPFAGEALIGVAACSRLADVTTTVACEGVRVF